MVPARAYADTFEVDPQEFANEEDPEGKNATEESISLNKWKNGSFTTAQSTTGYWYPDVYKFTVTTAGMHSIMIETKTASVHNSGLIVLLCNYYSKSSSGISCNPIAWAGLVGVPLGDCLEMDLEPGTYWLLVGDAYDIFSAIRTKDSRYGIDTFSDDIYSWLNSYSFDGHFVGTYRIGVFAHPAGAIPVYRMYNTRTSEHLYTKSVKEYNSCGVGTYKDWRQEGIAWFAPKKSSTPVYRLYNKRLLVHHYTTSKSERDSLVANNGWKYECVAFYSDDQHGKPLYRLYNGNIKPPQHHYTSSAGERDSLVKKYGWRNEGVGFYGVKS